MEARYNTDRITDRSLIPGGTAKAAARNAGRNFIGFEIDKAVETVWIHAVFFYV